MEIDVPPKIAIILRKEALAAMAREFAFTMGVVARRTLDTIVDGVRDELLHRVDILLFDSVGDDQGYVFFEIDWDVYELTVGATDAHEEFTIDITKNVAEQIAPVTAFVESYLRSEAQARGVTDLRTSYRWRHGANMQKLDALRAKYELGPIDSDRDFLLSYYRIRASLFGDDSFPEVSSGGVFRPLSSD